MPRPCRKRLLPYKCIPISTAHKYLQKSMRRPADACRDAAYKCVLEGCHAKAMQQAIMFMNGSLVRLLTMAQEEEPCRAKQALQIVVACALGEMQHGSMQFDTL